MDKRIHFIQVQPSKFGNQLKKIEVFNTFFEKQHDSEQGSILQIVGRNFVILYGTAFSFPFIGGFRHFYIIVENLRFGKDKKCSRDERENAFSK